MLNVLFIGICTKAARSLGTVSCAKTATLASRYSSRPTRSCMSGVERTCSGVGGGQSRRRCSDNGRLRERTSAGDGEGVFWNSDLDWTAINRAGVLIL